MSKNIPSPIIYPTKYNRETASNLDQEIKKQFDQSGNANLLIDYPTVYVINDAPRNHKAK